MRMKQRRMGGMIHLASGQWPVVSGQWGGGGWSHPSGADAPVGCRKQKAQSTAPLASTPQQICTVVPPAPADEGVGTTAPITPGTNGGKTA